jgi:LysM repeat protein
MPFPLLPIIIIERTGKHRPVVFFNAMLPRKGGYTNFDMKIRTKVSRYIGTAQATGQVLGTEFEPIQFHGMLEDRRIGVPGSAVAMMLLVQTVAKGGRECWFNYGPIFRRVLWKEVKFKTIELQRIRYEIVLEVLDDGLGQRKRVKKGSRTVPNVEEATTDINAAKGDLADVPDWVDPDAVEGADASLDSALNHTTEAGKHLDAMGSGDELLDKASAQGALTNLESAKGDMASASDFSNRLQWDEGVNRGFSEFQSQSSAGRGVLQADSSILDAGQTIVKLRDKVSVLAGNADVGRVYVAAEGDTLQSIATKFLGSPHRWAEIYQGNGMTNPLLSGGEQLILRNVPGVDPSVTFFPTDVGAPTSVIGAGNR